MKRLGLIAQVLENMFIDVAMAECHEFADPANDLESAAKSFECSFIDVTMAEADVFTETACIPAPLSKKPLIKLYA